MYGKIFESMFEGTLYGHWQAIVTLQQMLVLCNRDGVIDMTPQALAARTSIPLEIITKGIDVLAEPDPYSRTPGEEGRRIVLLDEHRPWGWLIVNYAKYRDMKNRSEKMEADRKRIADKRKAAKNKGVAGCRKASQPVANVAHVDVAASKVKSTGRASPAPPEFEVAWAKLPKRSGNNPRADALKAWNARIKAGVAPEVMIAGADRYRVWCEGTGKVGTETVMRGSTFFGSSNPFEQTFELPIVKERATGTSWRSSEAGIDAKGREVGLQARPRESYHEYAERISAKLSERAMA